MRLFSAAKIAVTGLATLGTGHEVIDDLRNMRIAAPNGELFKLQHHQRCATAC